MQIVSAFNKETAMNCTESNHTCGLNSEGFQTFSLFPTVNAGLFHHLCPLVKSKDAYTYYQVS